MAGISWYEKFAAAAAAICIVVSAGVLLGMDTGTQERSGYEISTQPVTIVVSPGVGEETPDSLLPGERININTAPARELERLPGIGERRAADIVAHREQNGAFRSVDELILVYGIGEATLEELRDYITVDEE